MHTQYIVNTGAKNTDLMFAVKIDGGPTYRLSASSAESAKKIVQGFEPNAPDSAFSAVRLKWIQGKGFSGSLRHQNE